MARILFLVDELPAPPRNGVTNTAYHHLAALRKEHDVSLLWLRPVGVARREEQLELNRALVENLWVLDLAAVPKGRAAWQEISGHAPYFAAAPFDTTHCCSCLANYDCDVLWAETIRPWSYVSAIERCLPVDRPRKKVAAISDSLTALLRSLGRHVLTRHWPLRTRATNAIQWVRSWHAARMESRILASADHILVQTPVDRSWIARISAGALAGRTHVVSNGVSPTLLAGSLPAEGVVFGHVGQLSSPLYVSTVAWILDDVLPAVQARCPRTEFSFLSASLPASILRRTINRPNVHYIPFLENIRDFYRQVPVLIVRSGKNFGLITRTLEAMAAGVVVIGDRGAFNGIPRFADGTHGFIAETRSEVVRILVRLFSGEISRSAVAAAARTMIVSDFQWAERFEKLRMLVCDNAETPLAA